MENKTIQIVNVITGEEFQREMTNQEITKRQQRQAERQSQETEQLAKAEARSAAEAKLLALGLTADDLKALLG